MGLRGALRIEKMEFWIVYIVFVLGAISLLDVQGHLGNLGFGGSVIMSVACIAVGLIMRRWFQKNRH